VSEKVNELIKEYVGGEDISLLAEVKPQRNEPFYIRHNLYSKASDWNNSYFSLSYVLDKFYPGVVAYLEHVFKNDTENPLFFNGVINEINLALFNDIENRFSISCKELLIKGSPQRGEEKEEVGIARGVERELQKNKFLLIYRFGIELYLLNEEEGKIFVERKKGVGGKSERYWEAGKFREWIEQNRDEMVIDNEDFLKGMILEKDEELRECNCSDVRLASKEELDKMLNYENRVRWTKGYKCLKDLVESAL